MRCGIMKCRVMPLRTENWSFYNVKVEVKVVIVC